MTRRSSRLILIPALLVIATGLAATGRDPGLVVHEWGTFTTVAGQDGTALQWLPLGGPVDLPCFVNRFTNNLQFKINLSTSGPPPTYQQVLRSLLRGTVRMETPVLYFYAAAATTADVSVRFPRGLITDWYPAASVSQAVESLAAPFSSGRESAISWTGVKITPGVAPRFPTEAGPSHYYAARQTDAAAVHVGGQDEKFLFYRGVGGFPVPLSTVLTDDGKVLVTSRGASGLRNVVLFENRGGRIGYRIHGEVHGQVVLDPPVLTGDRTSLYTELRGMLVAAGLYEREAQAMVETWRDSWFEEGTRIFYILPADAVDGILPLTIKPAPKSVARAFVGRMEIITPATMCAVRDAVAAHDDATLMQYGRFLQPIADRIAASSSPAERAQTEAALGASYQAYIARTASGCK